MNKSYYLFVIILVFWHCVDAKERYDKWKVARVFLPKEDISFVDELNLDVWSHDSNLIEGYNGIQIIIKLSYYHLIGKDIRVNETHLDLFTKREISFAVFIENVQHLIDIEEQQIAKAQVVF